MDTGWRATRGGEHCNFPHGSQLFHWPMLILFDFFVTAFLFNTIENKKDKIIPTLRATLISCYCQELTSINNRTENYSYQTTLPIMSIF